jgi:hypothetical protein
MGAARTAAEVLDGRALRLQLPLDARDARLEQRGRVQQRVRLRAHALLLVALALDLCAPSARRPVSRV